MSSVFRSTLVAQFPGSICCHDSEFSMSNQALNTTQDWGNKRIFGGLSIKKIEKNKLFQFQ